MESNEQMNIIFEKAKSHGGLAQYCTLREFEKSITDLAKSIDESKESLSFLKTYDEKDVSKLEHAFICFFVLFTSYRRNSNYKKMKELYEKYIDLFANDYPICLHITNLYNLNVYKNDRSLYKALKESMKIATEKDKNNKYDFTSHPGILHLFGDACATYYERNIEAKESDESKEIIASAIKCVDIAINEEPEYSKYYCTKGRLLGLSKKYDSAEEQIKEAISMEADKEKRDEHRIREFEQHLITISILRTHDITNDKVGELNKLKVDNYKTISLMTALLAFLLGTIAIFANLTNPLHIVFILLAYVALLLILLGVVLFALSLAMKDIKKKYIAFEISIFIVGVILFTTSLLLIAFLG